MHIRTFAVGLACGIAALAAPAFAQESAAPEPVQVASLKALPDEIRNALGADVVDVDGPFASGCIRQAGESGSRFAHAQVGPETAEVTIERGGRAHFFDTRQFRKVDGHWIMQPRSQSVVGRFSSPRWLLHPENQGA
jgi:hypothetical protein